YPLLSTDNAALPPFVIQALVKDAGSGGLATGRRTPRNMVDTSICACPGCPISCARGPLPELVSDLGSNLDGIGNSPPDPRTGAAYHGANGARKRSARRQASCWPRIRPTADVSV